MTKRKIVIPENITVAVTRNLKPSTLPNPVIPTGDPRHMPSIRFGKQKGDAFDHERIRKEIPVLYSE